MLDFDPHILRKIDIPPHDEEALFKPGTTVYLRGASQSFGKVMGFVKLRSTADPNKLFGVEKYGYQLVKNPAKPFVNPVVPRPWKCRQLRYNTEIFSELSSERVYGWNFGSTYDKDTEIVVVKHYLVRGPQLRVHHQYHLNTFVSHFHWEIRRLDWMQSKMKLADSLPR